MRQIIQLFLLQCQLSPYPPYFVSQFTTQKGAVLPYTTYLALLVREKLPRKPTLVMHPFREKTHRLF